MSLFNKIMGEDSPPKTAEELPKATGNPAVAGLTIDQVLARHGKSSGGGAQPIVPAVQPTMFSNGGGPPKEAALRPKTLGGFIGQEHTKQKLRKQIDAALTNREPMLHTLIAAKAGQGKTTLAHIIAEELGTTCWEVQAPVDVTRLLSLATQMRDGDVLLLDEVHLQARSKSAQAGPEVLYNIMEDRKLVGPLGPVKFPHVTVVGATTDEGLLPSSFRERFPIKCLFVDYDLQDLMQIADFNAKALGLNITADGMIVFGQACRGVPREINNMVKNACTIARSRAQVDIDKELAQEILSDEKLEFDGLTHPMIEYLHKLFARKRYSHGKGEWVIKASLGTMAHAIGRARDKSFVELEVEPELIKRGLIDIVPGGRTITEEGIYRIGEVLPSPPPRT